MAIPDNNDMLSLLMQEQQYHHNSGKYSENSKVLQPPEGWKCENCPWLLVFTTRQKVFQSTGFKIIQDEDSNKTQQLKYVALKSFIYL